MQHEMQHEMQKAPKIGAFMVIHPGFEPGTP